MSALRTVKCKVCGTSITFERRRGRPPEHCSPVCAEFSRQSARWAFAARALLADHPGLRAEGTGGRVTPKGLRMRIRHAVMTAATEVTETATEAAEVAREDLAGGVR